MGISRLANGVGIVIRTKPDGITVESTISNTPEGVVLIKRDAASRGPVSGEIRATGKVTILTLDAGGDTIQDVSVNGVNQMSSAGVNVTLGDTPQTMRDLAADINLSPPASGPRYTAQAIGDSILLTAPVGSGDSVNGDVVGITFLNSSTASTENISGGSDGSGTVDANSGSRYFLNATAGAAEGDVTAPEVEEITEFLIIRGVQGAPDKKVATIAAGTVVITRLTQFTGLLLNTEAAAANDDFDFLDPAGFQIGDRVTVAGNKLAEKVTLRDKSVSGGNLRLANQQSFTTGDSELIIQLIFGTDDAGAIVWSEFSRSPSQLLTGDSLWETGLPVDFGHRQEEVLAGGGAVTVKVDKPLDKSHLQLITTGLIVLTGNYSVAFTGGPAKDGQQVEVKYDGTATLGAFSITIFGIALTAREALVGGVLITAIWDDANSVWEFAKFYDHRKAGLIQTENILDDAVIEAKILDQAVSGAKVKDDSISTIKVQDSAITSLKINNGAVVLDKLESSLKDSTVAMAVSFETNEQGAYSFYPGFKCNLTRIISQVTKDLAPTNVGTIQAANTIGNMANGLITHAASAVFGDQQEVSPTTNQDVDPGGANDHFDFTSAKGNNGGRIKLILFLTRVN